MSNAHVSGGSSYGVRVATGGVSSGAHVGGNSGSAASVPPDSTLKAEQGTPIVVRVSGTPYTGPTTVVPTESQQTLDTDGKTLTDDITVTAISSSYVGSAVPRNDSDDLTASGDTVTAPAGYYAANASKAVDAATWKAGSILQPTMTTTVDAAGLVTAKASGTMSVWPIQTSGWAQSSKAYPIIFNETDTLQLPTQAAATITPTTSSQTAVAAGKFTTGAVTVDAIQTETASVTPSSSAQTIYPTTGHFFDEVDVAAVPAPAYQAKTIDPTWNIQTITADDGYDALSSLVVNGVWKKLGAKTLIVNTTSTTAATAGSFSTDSSTFTKSKIIYVRVRDKAGPRAGYFYGSDAFFINFQDANGSTSNATLAGRCGVFYNTSNKWASASSSYGVYGYAISSAGTITIRQRYNSSYGTINGSFLCEAYSIEFPDGKSPFDTGVIT